MKIELFYFAIHTNKTIMLARCYEPTAHKYEICIDEAGRGCLFGHVYIACVVLPKDENMFPGENIKDSKKFTSKKKIQEVAATIKENALYYHITHMDSKEIDTVNILQAVMIGMHKCIRETIAYFQSKDNSLTIDDFAALIDGNYFKPYNVFDSKKEMFVSLDSYTFEKGDGRFMGIAAAGILAKTARDEYVLELCEKHEELKLMYGLHTNMGYATKAHREGIIDHGITQWHRKSYAPCKGQDERLII